MWPGLDGIEICRAVRQFSQLPILMLTARAQLLDTAHADLRDVSDRAIDRHSKNLRRKIEAVEPGCECNASVYSVGYRMDSPD